MHLDMAKLRTLEAVHLLGSMTAAAAALGYTTGAVSQQIAALERSLSIELFEHVGRRVQLTDAGSVLFEYAGQLLALEHEAQEALRATDQSLVAHVRLGVFGTVAAELLPPALEQLRHQHAGLKLVTTEVNVDDATAAVESGLVHVAFGLDYSDAPIPRRPTVELRKLRSERFQVGVSSRRRRQTSPMSLEDLSEEAWILPPAKSQYGLAIRHVCRRAGFEPKVEHEVTDTASTLAMVAADLGVAPVTNLMLELRGSGIGTVSLREEITRDIVLAFRNAPRPRPGVQTVIDAIGQSVAPTQGDSEALACSWRTGRSGG